MSVVKKSEIYTIEDIYALPEGERAELIDGQIYYIAAPGRTHQRLLLSLSRKIFLWEYMRGSQSVFYEYMIWGIGR